MTQAHLDNHVMITINESYDRDHPANKFMQNVHFNYQYYFGSDLPRDALEALNLGDVQRPAFRKFFQQCLDKSEEFKARNEKYCKGSVRYSEPTRVNVGRIIKRAFK